MEKPWIERVPFAARLGIVFVAYVLGGQIGLRLGSLDQSPLTALWPPSGVSLAAILLWGYRIWPALIVADIVGSLTAGIPILVTPTLALATIVEPVVAAWVLRRASFRRGLDSLRSVLWLIAVAAFAPPLSATLGIGVLVASGVVPIDEASDGWSVWWLSDAVAILVIAPFALVWMTEPTTPRRSARTGEAAGLGALAILVPLVVFAGPGAWRSSSFFQAYLVFPLLVWAALRFGLRGVVSVGLVAAGIAAAATLRELGPFWSGDVGRSLLSVQLFMTLQASTSLLMAASIAERQRAQERTREMDRRLRRFVETTQEGVWSVDRNDRTTYVNERMAAMIGYRVEELAGRSILDLMDTASAARAARRLGRGADGAPDTFDVKLLHRKGHEVWAIMATTPILEAGEVTGSFAMLTDISERKHAEEELERHRGRLEGMVAVRTRELERANRELEAFSYSVSHDLRSPLRGIEAMGRALREDHAESLDAEGLRLLGRLREETARMIGLIDDLLALSRVTTGEMEVKPVDLTSLAQASAREIAERRPGVDVDLVLQDDVWVVGDARLLKIVLDNLLDNAWKYSVKAAHPRVEFGATREPDGTVVHFVRDNGVGFDPAKASELLFRPFGRLHSALEYPGTGVGLATVRRIIERHKGRVWAESAPGQGARFCFTLGAAPRGGQASSA